MRKTSIERANFRLIESELYNFHETVQELKRMEEDIIHSAPIMDESQVRIPGISKTTEKKAVKLATSLEIVELSRRVKAIQNAIDVLKIAPEPRKLELLEKKYFERRLTNEGIMMSLGIEQATFYRWRREIVQLVAQKLGWKV